jgi:frataxin-like iron-binding protein CyaY
MRWPVIKDFGEFVQVVDAAVNNIEEQLDDDITELVLTFECGGTEYTIERVEGILELTQVVG